MPHEALGPETRALFTTRRWLDTMLALALVAVAASRAIPSWNELTTTDHIGLFAAVLLVLAGAILGSTFPFLWLCPAGLLALTVTALTAPHGSPAWIPMPNAASYAAYISITLVGRRTGLVLIFVGPALVESVWLLHPSNIVANSMALWGGWLVAGQVLASSVATWWAWNSLLGYARVSDADFRDREKRAEQSLREQERARVWRTAAARVHESLLNTIRYVLETTNLDRDRLVTELQRPGLAPETVRTGAVPTSELLLSQVLADPDAAHILRLPTSYDEFEMSPDVFEATRNALVEVAHNSVRHGSATELRTTFDTDDHGLLTVHAIDNGSGLTKQSRPGIGSTQVIRDALTAVGGSVSLSPAPQRGVDAKITVPVSPISSDRKSGSPNKADTSFDQGRYLFSLPLAAGATWGILYFIIIGSLRPLDRTGGAHFWLTIVCGIAGSLIAMYVTSRRYKPGVIVGLALTMIPAFVPWFLRTSDYTCANVPNVAGAINMAGFAIVAIAMWTGYVPGAAAVLTWLIGASITMQRVPVECQSTVKLAMANSALILPLAAITTFVGIRSFQRAAERTNQIRVSAIVEASRAATAADLNDELFLAVEQANGLLAEVAGGRDLNDQTRRDLEAYDARIRASVQVDPTTAGGAARSIKRVVDLAASLGVPVSVRAISASSDQRPLPARIEDLLATAVSTTTDIRPTIQVFNDGRQDFISLLIDRNGLTSAGLAGIEGVTIDGIDIQVLEEDDLDDGIQTYSVLVTRAALI